MKSPMVNKVIVDTLIATDLFTQMMAALHTVQIGSGLLVAHVAHEATCRGKHD